MLSTDTLTYTHTRMVQGGYPPCRHHRVAVHCSGVLCTLPTLHRLNHFRSDFLRAPPTGEGSQQVVEWSAARLAQWLKSVDLAELVPCLKNQGIHGALLVGGWVHEW